MKIPNIYHFLYNNFLFIDIMKNSHSQNIFKRFSNIDFPPMGSQEINLNTKSSFDDPFKSEQISAGMDKLRVPSNDKPFGIKNSHERETETIDENESFKMNDFSFESQMDDYMIDRVSEEDETPPLREEPNDKRFIQEEISDLATEEDIHQFQKEFYNKNYFGYEMIQYTDPVMKRVWNLQIDPINDIVYVLLAKVKILEGNPIQTNDMSVNSEIQLLDVYKSCQVQLKLMLELWNVDDRLLLDKSHTKRPYAQKVILMVQETFEYTINQAQIMRFLQNKYRDFSTINFIGEDVIYFQSQENLVRYNVEQKAKINTQPVPLKVPPNVYQTFQTYCSEKNNDFEKMLIFIYTQQMINGKPSQTFEIRSITFNEKILNEKQKKSKGYGQDQYSFVDDRMFKYYKQSKTCNNLQPFELQKIGSSQTYMLLFPTGTLFIVGLDPINIQSKIQLNLKHDEVIIDKSYCISQSGKNHCFWLLDSQLQIWKCSNELEANSSNWTLIKMTVLKGLHTFQRFMHPAMTYYDYYLISYLNGIQVVRDFTHKIHKNQSSIVAYNRTTTKLVMVIQPFFKENSHHHGECNKNRIQMPRDQMMIKLQCFAKRQHLILNKIAEKDPIKCLQFKKFSEESNPRSIFSNVNNFMKKLMVTKFEENDEILELQYMGQLKTNNSSHGSVVYMRQFLVRRKHILEVMITNGLTFQIYNNKASQCAPPYEISDIILSKDNQILLAYYSLETNAKEFYIQQFQYSDEHKNFQLVQKITGTSNLTIMQNGKLLEILITFVQAPLNKHNLRQSILVKTSKNKIQLIIYEDLIPPQLLDKVNAFERVVISSNSRVVMCGRVIIHLNETFDDVSDIGCIILVKIKSFQSFQFWSLLNESERQGLMDQCQKTDESIQKIVKYESEFLQVSSIDDPSIMYMNYRLIDNNKQNEETIILKLNCNTLNCLVVYQSKFKIIHIAIVENKELITKSSEIANQTHEDFISVQVQSQSEKKPIENPFIFFKKNKSEKSKGKVNISLISQTQKQINIEIIEDIKLVKIDQNFVKSILRSSRINQMHEQAKLDEQIKNQQQKKAKLIYFVNIVSQKDLLVTSEIGWVSQEKLILTINNRYHLLNLQLNNMIRVQNGILYGKQHMSSDLFVSIVKKVYTIDAVKALKIMKTQIKDTAQRLLAKKDCCNINQIKSQNPDALINSQNNLILVSQDSIKRMEIASFSKFVQIFQISIRSDFNKTLQFFIPCEELAGASIFSLLSFNINIIQPYIDKVDETFIDIMNNKIKNIMHYNLTQENTQQKNSQFRVHMYQDDISGDNAIERAFRKNSIFCIQSFVESVLQLSKNEDQFHNCFDKALLLMINRNIDVKDLVNSNLFYPKIFKRHQIFSEDQQLVIKPYFWEFEELEYEDPIALFKKNIGNNLEQIFKKMFSHHHDTADCNREKHEMQFKYLCMDKIQGNDKIQLTKTLMDSQDLALFEQEAIQVIIDFKWTTYAKKFFFIKFYIYLVFISSFYIDIGTLNYDEYRNKNFWYGFRKVIGMTIQFFFLSYEFVQFKQEGQEYWHDWWNILELLGIFCYFWGSILDIKEEEVTDLMRIVYTVTCLISLVKVLYLIRVFKTLSFLVMMVIQVVFDVRYLIVIYAIFSFSFAQMFYIVEVDVSYYGRMPKMMSLFIACLRASMGDFAIIDPFVGFDPFDTVIDEFGQETLVRRHSQSIAVFTVLIFVVSSLMLMMIFMNLIIAVISDTYLIVSQHYVAHDYRQRAIMIYEREVHFNQEDFQNENYFPNIIIVRKKRETVEKEKTIQNQIASLRGFIKNQNNSFLNEIFLKQKEKKDNLINQVKQLEKEILNVHKDVKIIHNEIAQKQKSESENRKESERRQIQQESEDLKLMLESSFKQFHQRFDQFKQGIRQDISQNTVTEHRNTQVISKFKSRKVKSFSTNKLS